MWLLFLLIAHWTACGWWALGHADFNQPPVSSSSGGPAEPSQNVKLPWPHPARIASASGSTASLDDGASAFGMRYWTCMYWAITSLMKVPWLHPATFAEQAFTSVVVVTRTLFYAFIVGETSAIATKGIREEIARTALMDKLETLNTHHDISASRLTHPNGKGAYKDYWFAKRWIKANADFGAGYARQEMLSHQLPLHLRNEALLALHAPVLAPSPITGGISDDAIAEVAACLTPRAVLPSMVVIQQGMKNPMLFFLLRGSLKIHRVEVEEEMPPDEDESFALVVRAAGGGAGGGAGAAGHRTGLPTKQRQHGGGSDTPSDSFSFHSPGKGGGGGGGGGGGPCVRRSRPTAALARRRLAAAPAAASPPPWPLAAAAVWAAAVAASSRFATRSTPTPTARHRRPRCCGGRTRDRCRPRRARRAARARRSRSTRGGRRGRPRWA